MKKRLSFIALAFAMVAVSVILFSACDWLFENDDNNENPPVTGNSPGDNFEYVAGTTET